ncbi:MAG: FAD binding domain-containing protein [Clostridia bacterium]|nr:FAD binding domain-containing protein [Clostridia bacterium]
MITIHKYVRAQSLEEAYALNQSRRNRIIGGMLWLKMSTLNIATAIDLSGLGLDTIEETDDAFSIGAMVTLRQLEQHQGLNRYMNGAAAEAVSSIVGVQFRNMATVGGSLWGRFGFSDVLTLFLAADSYVELYKGGVVPLAQFAAMKPDRDILVRLIVKKTSASFAYRSMRIQRTDFPVITCAVSRVNDCFCASVGARPHKAILLRDDEGILAGGITEESAAAFASSVAQRCPTGGNLRGSAAYRTHLIRVLVKRAILALGGNA